MDWKRLLAAPDAYVNPSVQATLDTIQELIPISHNHFMIGEVFEPDLDRAICDAGHFIPVCSCPYNHPFVVAQRWLTQARYNGLISFQEAHDLAIWFLYHDGLDGLSDSQTFSERR